MGDQEIIQNIEEPEPETTPPISPIEKRARGRPAQPKEAKIRKPQTPAQLANLERGREKARINAAKKRASKYEADLAVLENIKEPTPPVKRARQPVNRLPEPEPEEYEEEYEEEYVEESSDSEEEIEKLSTLIEERIYQRMQKIHQSSQRQTTNRDNRHSKPVNHFQESPEEIRDKRRKIASSLYY